MRVWVIVALVVGAASAASAQARVHVESDPPGVWLHHRTGGAPRAPWLAACAAPCDAIVPTEVVLGLSLDGRHVHAATPSPLFGDPTRIHLRYEDHARVRMLGLVTLIVGALVGVGMVLGGVVGLARTTGSVDEAAAAVGGIGAAVLTLGLVVGIVLVGEPDRVEVRVEP